MNRARPVETAHPKSWGCLKAQGPSRTCNESKKEKEEVGAYPLGSGELAVDLPLNDDLDWHLSGCRHDGSRMIVSGFCVGTHPTTPRRVNSSLPRSADTLDISTTISTGTYQVVGMMDQGLIWI